jgi:hypothetical protein
LLEPENAATYLFMEKTEHQTSFSKSLSMHIQSTLNLLASLLSGEPQEPAEHQYQITHMTK